MFKKLEMGKEETIKFLFEGINVNTIPEGIYRRLSCLDLTRSFLSVKGEKVYGDLILPHITYIEDLDFYVIAEWLDQFDRNIEQGLLNENFEKLNGHNHGYLLEEFGKGFKAGYYSYEDKLKRKDSIFETTNDQIAFKVYSYVDTFFNRSTFSFGVHLKDGENKRYVSPDSMYKDGLDWGNQYRAWQMILNNIPLFESLFKKYEQKSWRQELNKKRVLTDEERLSSMEGFIQYLEKGLEYLERKNYSSADIPENFDSTIKASVFIDNINKAVQSIFDTATNKVEVKENILTILSTTKLKFEANILDPLLSDRKEINAFLAKKIEVIYNLWKTANVSSKKTESQKLSTRKKLKTSFDFNNIKKESKNNLKTLLTQLDLNIGILSEKSTIENLLNVLTCSDYSKCKAVSLDCETTQFKYIIKKLQPNFKELSFANIGRSKLFVSSSGNIISSSNLSSRSYIPKLKEVIDKVFNENII